ncbi:MAG: hypothetical protein ACRD8A_15775 [Candidatus Acidiferrales bacterium]
MAVALAALLFAVSVRNELHPGYSINTWLLFDGLHGWLSIAVNAALYGYFCWMAFSFIYASKGRERLMLAGACGFLLSPVKMIHPEWAVPVGDLEFFGITVSVVAALSLLVYPEAMDSAGAPTPPQP